MTGFSRRAFLAGGGACVSGAATCTVTATAGAIAALPLAARAAGHDADAVQTEVGPIAVNPVSHASVVLETPKGVIYVDPVGDPAAYDGFARPDLVLVTHEHGDHFRPETLGAIRGDAPLVTNPAVMALLPDSLKPGARALENGGSATALDMRIDAIPAYNTTPERRTFHPRGRDNGYLVTLGGVRLYLSGDTEDTPEMRGLRGIDLAFVCMNLPFTMGAGAAADAVRAFRPAVVYPYHYRGRDGGTQDPAEFARLVGDAAEVRLADWY